MKSIVLPKDKLQLDLLTGGGGADKKRDFIYPSKKFTSYPAAYKKAPCLPAATLRWFVLFAFKYILFYKTSDYFFHLLSDFNLVFQPFAMIFRFHYISKKYAYKSNRNNTT